MTRLAVIGTGIAGLSAAHLLQRRFELQLFEKERRIGGHSNTLLLEEEGREVAVDSGFMVYNEVTYPLLTALFRELGVETMPTDMSFSVQHRPSGLEFNGSSLSQLFAQRRNLLRPRHYRLLLAIDRFNREAPGILADGAAGNLTVGELVSQRGYGEDFLQRYLIPMSAAVWSTSFDGILDFPAETLLRFFHNHGFLGLHTQHPWRTVVGGSRRYVEKLIAPFRERIHAGDGVVAVRRKKDSVELELGTGARHEFDGVILACHADEALRLLVDPSATEQRLLAPFRYQRNEAVLHTDRSVMPRARRAWASWNYRVTLQGERTHGSTVYWMNSLQSLSTRRDYFVSIDDPGEVQPDCVLQRIEYHHPLFTNAALAAQAQLPLLNQLEGARTFFCGSYFGYGFHEDAVRSGFDVARLLTERAMAGVAA